MSTPYTLIGPGSQERHFRLDVRLQIGEWVDDAKIIDIKHRLTPQSFSRAISHEVETLVFLIVPPSNLGPVTDLSGEPRDEY